MSATRNGLWSIGLSAVPMFTSALFLFVLARILPIDLFGIYSYAIALVSLGLTVTSAGLNALAIRILVADRDGNRPILGALLAIREVFGLLAYVLILVLSLTSGENLAVLATMIAGLALFARATDVGDIWFQSVEQTKRAATIRLISAIIWLGVRLALAMLWPSIWVFLAVFVVEPFITSAIVLIRFYRDDRSPGIGRPNLRLSKNLIRHSFPLVLSGLSEQSNTRAAIIIIQIALGSSQVGLYAAAQKLSEMTYFIPQAFMSGTFPSLLAIREMYGATSAQYRASLQRSFDTAFWLGVPVAVGLGFGGPLILRITFGADYVPAAVAMSVLAVATPFVYMAAVASKWIIAEGKLWASTRRHIAGAIVNIGLSCWLTPWLGIAGAATASGIAVMISTYVSFFVSVETRPIAVQMSRAIVWPIRLLLGRRRRGEIE